MNTFNVPDIRVTPSQGEQNRLAGNQPEKSLGIPTLPWESLPKDSTPFKGPVVIYCLEGSHDEQLDYIVIPGRVATTTPPATDHVNVWMLVVQPGIPGEKRIPIVTL